MNLPADEREKLDHGAPGALLERALLIDLEVSQQGRLKEIGCVLGRKTLSRKSRSPEELLAELALMAGDAKCLLGHNIVRHDLAYLRQAAPNHSIHRLPAIDTLVLSPICFPENPYHRLVKDYKLVRESINDPVADARQAAALFEDEFRSLAGLRQNERRLFDALNFLLCTSDSANDQLAMGLSLVFHALDTRRPTRNQTIDLCRELIPQWGCRSFPIDERLLQTGEDRMTLAYTLTWLRIAGSNSVLPPWVRGQHPGIGELIRALRERPCNDPECGYCRLVHDSTEQLRTFFGFDSFRQTPAGIGGGSLQREIVEAGMRDESLLAILPTGGGKSLCFQLPALVRNYRRGVLTIIISPLQALMKDQVEGLTRRTGTLFGAALSGLLTPPERSDVLRGIRLGDVALLYISPEQLRNRSFAEAIKHREIGCWVFDEAHCLSKWGHDFRPDYLYAGRFIREFSRKQKTCIPPIACFTATAKQEVRDEILSFFKEETGCELKTFEGGVERDNLHFEVHAIAGAHKLEQVRELLSERLAEGHHGSAIVFRATRNETETTAEYLRCHGWKADHFHAGLLPSGKKLAQDQFLAGETTVICATNAFGMGIDKEDVRLVIHADTPGSLENYLQEAGRAGRDGRKAECVLLYTDDDCERQFRMAAFSELSRRDISGILRTLRKAARGDKQELVITTGEILRDEELEIDLDLQDRMADTKVRTAIAWLERAQLLERNENVTNVFQARPLVQNLAEARARIASLNLSETEQGLWIAILREIFNTPPTESLTVDRLALLPEFNSYAKANSWASANPEFLSGKILKLLGSMTEVGLMKRDMRLTAFVRHKVADHSRLRLDRVAAVDKKLIDVLALEQPDPEGWMPLSLNLLNHRLLSDGFECSSELVRSLLKSLSEDGRGLAGSNGSIDLRYAGRDSYRVRVRRSWTAISELADKRRRLASVVLDALLAKVPSGAQPSADYLVDFSFEQLHKAIDQDLLLRAELKDIEAGIERALMFLHEQRVIVLQHGLAVFRSAMSIRFIPETRRDKYRPSDYQPLEHHYKERVLQVHVMSEYARLGAERIQAAIELVLAYFKLGKEDFLRRYLKTKPELLQHATTAQSFQRIVTDLSNPAQVRIVTAPVSRNMLILAGPGSGKTRTIVHRCAWLLRVQRVRPQSILVCCYNRHAAVELRRRLSELVGDDARGVTVLTYHALAMRLAGFSYSVQATRMGEVDFDALIENATKLLRGEHVPPGVEEDEVRDRLLAGFQHILVDEYQDIDRAQYQLISAVAGRKLVDPDLKLSILAVGDDDQNIYTFRGANVQFIQRFKEDYDAQTHYLVENYRSTVHIIETANEFISLNLDRMKRDHPIRIDRHRKSQAQGGEFTSRDRLYRGKVQLVEVADFTTQARAVLAEIRRLRGIGVSDLSGIAVLSREHRDLAHVRTLAEEESLPIRWAASRHAMPPLHQVREIRLFISALNEHRQAFRRASELLAIAKTLFPNGDPNPWTGFLHRILEDWKAESSDAELPAQQALEFIYEMCSESRREFTYGEGVTLSTVHSAKGTEFDHVLLIGPWRVSGPRKEREEERRAFYVGMTRARKTLAMFDRLDIRPSLPGGLTASGHLVRSQYTIEGTARACEELNYEVLSLDDIHIGYPGQFGQAHPIHRALKTLGAGDTLRMRELRGESIGLFYESTCVARLSRKGCEVWRSRMPMVREVRVIALMTRSASQDPEQSRLERYQLEEWEVPVVEIVWTAFVQPGRPMNWCS
jgi:ATP-dependent DNA helicase RecQ